MLELMLECERTLKRMENTLNEMWAEWTRLHVPTIDRSGPKPKAPGEKRVVRRVLR